MNLIDRYQEIFGSDVTVVACGGLVNAVVPHCRHKIVIDEHLLLDGLFAIFRKNRSLS